MPEELARGQSIQSRGVGESKVENAIRARKLGVGVKREKWWGPYEKRKAFNTGGSGRARMKGRVLKPKLQ